MGRPRCPLALLLICCSLDAHAARVARNASTTPVTAVGKVTEMLQQMEAKSIELQRQASLDAATTEQGCAQETTTKTAEVESLKLQVQSLEADVSTGETQVDQLKQEILQLDRDVASLSTQLEVLRLGRTNQSQTFSQELADLNFAVAATDRAIDVLKQQQQQGASLLAAAPRVALASAAAAASLGRGGRGSPSAQGLLELRQHYTPDGGGIARDEHIFDEFESLSTAQAGYVHVSSSIEGTLNGLRQSFEQQKTDLLNKEKLDHVTYQNEEQSFVDRLKLARDDQAVRTSTLATSQADLTNKKQELAQSRQNQASTEAYLQRLQEDCAAKRQAYEEVRVLRESELKAVQAALQIITGQLPALTRPSLLRLKQAAVVPAVRKPALDAVQAAAGARKVVGFLRLEAQQLRSESLGALAAELGALAGGRLAEGANDPLAEVKVMITQLIERLKQQSVQEASHNAWCETELKRNEEAQTTAKEDLQKHSALSQKLDGDIQKLGLEVADLNATLLQNQVRRQQLDEQRANQSNESAQVVADAEASATAVDAAIALLQEFYANLTTVLQSGFKVPANASGNYSSNASAVQAAIASGNVSAAPVPEELQSVVSVLEVVRDDYRDLVTKTQAMETAAAQTHYEETSALQVADAAATRDRDLKQAQRGVYQSQLAQARENVNTSTQDLQDAQSAYEKLKPPCLDVETYEEKKMRRDTEIQALQEAYNMLVQYEQDLSGSVSLLQGPSGQVVPPKALQHRAASAALLDASNSTDNTSEASTVAGLLSGIRDEVAADLAADQQVYNDMEQWCNTTIPQMQASLAQNLDRDRELVTTIETSTHSKAQLESQVSQLEAELAKERTSLQQHSALREKEMKQFHESEKELLMSTQKLQQAIGILQSHYDRSQQQALNATAEKARLETLRQDLYSGTRLENGTNATGQDSSALIHVAVVVQQALRSLPAGEARVAAASAEASEALQGFFARPQDLLLHSAYGSQASLTELSSTLTGAGADSRQVFGVLQQLLETFTEDLQAVRLKEQQDSTTSKSLTETKTAQITALEASLASKRTQLAQHSTTLADAKTDLAYLRQTREADTQRLLDIQQSCLETKQEFQVRWATRVSELQALGSAIAILEAADSSASGGSSSSGGAANFLLHGGGGGSGRIFVRHHQPWGGAAGAAAAPPRSAPPRAGSAASVVDAFLRAHRSPGSSPAHGSSPGSAAAGARAAPGAAAAALGASAPRAGSRKAAVVAAAAPPPPTVAASPHAASQEATVPSAAAAALGASAPRAGGRKAAAVAAVAPPPTAAAPAHAASREAKAHPPAKIALVMSRPGPAGISHGGGRTGGRRLAAVTTHVRLASGGRAAAGEAQNALVREAIGRVVAEIDLLVASVEKEGALEARMKDTCLFEERQAKEQFERRTTEESAHNATIDRLNATITSLEPEISGLRAEIQALNSSLDVLRTMRSQETSTFQQAVQKEQAHQAKLHQAIDALRRHYGPAALSLLRHTSVRAIASNASSNVTNSSGASSALNGSSSGNLVSNVSNGSLPAVPANASRPPPASTSSEVPPMPKTFSRPLRAHEGSYGILDILDLLLKDSQSLVESMLRAEEQARGANSVDLNNAQRSIDEKDRQIIELLQKKGVAEQQLQQTESLKALCQQEMGQIDAFLVIVAGKCTVLLNNYDTNQERRSAELSNLRDAKFYLQGMVAPSALEISAGRLSAAAAAEASSPQLRGGRR